MNDAFRDFATKYTAAWCSQDAESFMTAFPDMVVTMDDVSGEQGSGVYRWTLTGTNTGPDGTGKAVRISGYEEWTFGADGLILKSLGHFDEADYQRQLTAGHDA